MKIIEPLSDIPSALPDIGRPFWPDLSTDPTTEWLRRFRRETRKSPDARLVVMSALRSLVVVDLAAIWAYVSSLVALVALVVALVLTIDVFWLQVLTVVLALLFCGGLLGLLLDIHAKADRRRRSAQVWLCAIEDELR